MKDVRKPEPPLLRTAERGDAKRCLFLWQQRWLLGYVPVREPTWAVFGKAWHKALEIYYPVGRKRGSVLDAIDMFLVSLDEEGRKIGVDIADLEEAEQAKAEAKGKDVKLVPARELGPLMMKEYHQFWDGDKDWQVIHTEQTFQIDVPDPDFPGETIVVYCGTWDALMLRLSDRRLWLWDHKSAKVIPNPGYLDLNDQAGTYPWVAREVLLHKGIITKKDRIHGIVFSYAKKSPPDLRPVNAAGESLNKPTKPLYVAALTGVDQWTVTDLRKKTVDELDSIAAANYIVVEGEVSQKQPAKRFERHVSPRGPKQIVAQARRVQDEAVWLEMVRNGELPIIKTPTHECERCQIFDLCQLHEAGEDWEFYREEMFKIRDPYADHREEMQRNGVEIRRRK